MSHNFEELMDVSVRVCTCGKWEMHHVHTGDINLCLCDECHTRKRLGDKYGSVPRPSHDQGGQAPAEESGRDEVHAVMAHANSGEGEEHHRDQQ